MKFSVTDSSAKPGEKLTITLVNLGTTPKFSMGHNWVLVTDARCPAISHRGGRGRHHLNTSGDAEGPHLAATNSNQRDTVMFTRRRRHGDAMTFSARTPGTIRSACEAC